ncbi:MAG: molecular chaperone TorD family protein [Acidobacteria bacterium]|nr:molecular chaperone TorD family protein [Acidobacteriota bacterium]
MDSTEIRARDGEQFRDEALARSVLYGTLSIALHVPTEEILRQLRTENTKQILREAASFLASTAREKTEKQEAQPDADAGVDLVARVVDWLQTLDKLTLEAWLTIHSRLFGHTARGLVCPYEAEYGQEGLFEQPRQLAKIMGFYAAFGLMTKETERERPDHISCELEFLEFLSCKEALALESEQEDMLRETRKAIRLFLKEHVGRFGLAFARLLREQATEGFHGELGNFLLDFLKMECQRVGVPPGPVALPLRSAEEGNVPMACAEQSELIQLQVPQ